MKEFFEFFDWESAFMMFMIGVGAICFIVFLVLAIENENVAYLAGWIVTVLCVSIAAGMF